MSRYHLTPVALADATSIQDYIAQDSPGAAVRWLDALEQLLSRLAENPQMGRPREELRPRLRSIPLGRYVVFYRESKRGVEIIRVLHSARDIQTLFSRS
ncbi:plasmid stabilization protein [Opitutaceae bacterium TAV5]|nr:plasmid stabilization protein [Opitutaceae bacterium TAV5]